MSKPTFGVLVGKFQVNALHDGHRELFDQVMARHKSVIVFVGVSPARLTRDNPLNFAVREKMIKAEYPDFLVLPLPDCKDDGVWSRLLDAQIDNIADYADITLYGGRDSFVPHYTGKYKSVELTLDIHKNKITGTDIRKEFSDKVLSSSDFRAGMIYTMNQLWPVMLQMVDVAPLSYDMTEILLGRRENETQFRFLGGHVETKKINLEGNAKAEALEEGGVELLECNYIGSCVIDDWRYRYSDRSVMTAFFVGRVAGMGARAGDDIAEVQWVRISGLKETDLVSAHAPLLKLLTHYLAPPVGFAKEAQNAGTAKA